MTQNATTFKPSSSQRHQEPIEDTKMPSATPSGDDGTNTHDAINSISVTQQQQLHLDLSSGASGGMENRMKSPHQKRPLKGKDENETKVSHSDAADDNNSITADNNHHHHAQEDSSSLPNTHRTHYSLPESEFHESVASMELQMELPMEMMEQHHSADINLSSFQGNNHPGGSNADISTSMAPNQQQQFINNNNNRNKTSEPQSPFHNLKSHPMIFDEEDLFLVLSFNRKLKNREKRNKKHRQKEAMQRLATKEQPKVEWDRNHECTFQPQTTDKSNQLAKTRGNVWDRLDEDRRMFESRSRKMIQKRKRILKERQKQQDQVLLQKSSKKSPASKKKRPFTAGATTRGARKRASHSGVTGHTSTLPYSPVSGAQRHNTSIKRPSTSGSTRRRKSATRQHHHHRRDSCTVGDTHVTPSEFQQYPSLRRATEDVQSLQRLHSQESFNHSIGTSSSPSFALPQRGGVSAGHYSPTRQQLPHFAHRHRLSASPDLLRLNPTHVLSPQQSSYFQSMNGQQDAIGAHPPSLSPTRKNTRSSSRKKRSSSVPSTRRRKSTSKKHRPSVSTPSHAPIHDNKRLSSSKRRSSESKLARINGGKRRQSHSTANHSSPSKTSKKRRHSAAPANRRQTPLQQQQQQAPSAMSQSVARHEQLMAQLYQHELQEDTLALQKAEAMLLELDDNGIHNDWMREGEPSDDALLKDYGFMRG